MSEGMKRTVYTDGACKYNPGPCGWAWYCLETKEEGYGNFRMGTNNVAEMTAVLMAIGAQPDGSEVLIVTDSEQVIGFIGKNWKSHSNPQLGELKYSIRELVRAKNIKLFLKKVKGHADDPANLRVDRLASDAAERARDLPLSQDDFEPLHLELVIRNMDFPVLSIVLQTIESMGADASGTAYAYDAAGNVVASAKIEGRKMEVWRPE